MAFLLFFVIINFVVNLEEGSSFSFPKGLYYWVCLLVFLLPTEEVTV